MAQWIWISSRPLEAQLKTGTASVAEPVEVEEPKVLPELEVLPQPEPAREPNAAWVWVRQNTPTTVALVSAVTAFVLAVVWALQVTMVAWPIR